MTNHYPSVRAIAFKDDVLLDVLLTDANLDPCMIGALRAAMRTAPQLHNNIMVITSATDGVHGDGSLHGVGCAFDIRFTGNRTGGINCAHEHQEPQAVAWAHRMKQQLGPDYDVVVEADHLHVEWDPK
jgi:hypothetical protein